MMLTGQLKEERQALCETSSLLMSTCLITITYSETLKVTQEPLPGSTEILFINLGCRPTCVKLNYQ